MKVLESRLRTDEIRINVVETTEDLLAFKAFVGANPELLGFDTETTGLDWWNAGDGFSCRLAQFGNGYESYVIPVELGQTFANAVSWALWKVRRLVAQNRGFDIHVVESCFGIPGNELLKKTWDTKILAHLVDSRAVKEGGIGLKLEELVPHYIDHEMGAEVKKSMTTIALDLNRQKKVVGYSFKDKAKEKGIAYFADDPEVTKESLKAQGCTYIREVKQPIYGKVTKENVWRKVPLTHEGYNLYAGMDPIFAYRLFHILLGLVPPRSRKKGLIAWEHRLHYVTYQMERTGYLVDEEYTKARIKELKEEEARWKVVAAKYGVTNIGASAEIIEALTNLGFKLTKRTSPSEKFPEGQLSTDESVLSSIDHPLTEAILNAKSAAKKRKTWFENALNNRDKNGRIHASINSIQARTARMSITGAIAGQTLPAGTGYVRHCFLADDPDLDENGNIIEEYVTVSIDYSSMELMFLAAGSGDKRMLKAYHEGEDLHSITAAGAFGLMGWDPNDKGARHPKRKAGKGTNYTVCFGGGWEAVRDQWDIEDEDAKKAVNGFWTTYPATKKLKNKFQQEARRNGYIYTATGRRILTDPKRPYAGMNYWDQSSCRDITARAIIELDKAGFTPYMRLPVHDEIVMSLPKSRAEELAKKAAEIMAFTYKGLTIPADYEIGDRSWGSCIEKEGSKH